MCSGEKNTTDCEYVFVPLSTSFFIFAFPFHIDYFTKQQKKISHTEIPAKTCTYVHAILVAGFFNDERDDREYELKSYHAHYRHQ
jgi:hypothetical protein